MSDESIKYYELLGVAPGVSVQELKTAHRDLAKVWHPDRFAHDPRLQQKAQDKLKEINEAYDRLISGKTGRSKPPSRPANQNEYQPAQPTRARASVKRRRSSGRLVSAFILLLFSASFALFLAGKQRGPSGTAAQDEQARVDEKEEGRQPGDASASPIESQRSKRTEQQQSSREAKAIDAPAASQEVKNARVMPTVTVLIDPVTGMLATPDCPNKSRMTYPSGMEPRQYCTAQHKVVAPAPEDDAARAKESRIKSFAKRLLRK